MAQNVRINWVFLDETFVQVSYNTKSKEIDLFRNNIRKEEENIFSHHFITDHYTHDATIIFKS
jgi:hypothetical protein